MKKRAARPSMHRLVGLRVLNADARKWGVVTGYLAANTTQPERVTVKTDDGLFAAWPVAIIVEGMEL